jgi:hypothetical protein
VVFHILPLVYFCVGYYCEGVWSVGNICGSGECTWCDTDIGENLQLVQGVERDHFVEDAVECENKILGIGTYNNRHGRSDWVQEGSSTVGGGAMQ